MLGGSAGRGPATAMGGMVTIREAAKVLDMPLAGATCAIQGYGNVGSFAHRLAHNLLGLKVTAVSDEFGGIYCEGGLDPEVVSAHMRRNGKVGGCPGSEAIGNAELLELPVDILIPAAIENQLTAANADRIRARIVAELANGPTTPEADQVLTEKGVYIIPDFLCNAGGVTTSYFEWCGTYGFYYGRPGTVLEKMTTASTPCTRWPPARHRDTHGRHSVAARVAEAVRTRGCLLSGGGCAPARRHPRFAYAAVRRGTPGRHNVIRIESPD
jgi:glutamate dehydrogenase (NAD(P)+)